MADEDVRGPSKMAEITKQLVTNPLALEELHAQLGAQFRDDHGWRVPATYGNAKAEYEAVRDGGAGLIDLSSRGRIRVGGTEAVLFLNGLITNDMKTLAHGRWMPAVFPTVQGRLIASIRVLRLPDDVARKSPEFVLDTEANTRAVVLKTIERFTIAGDFRVQDVTSETVMLTVQGNAAASIAARLFGQDASQLPRDGAVETEWEGKPLTLLRATHTAEDGFDVIINNDHAASLWDRIVVAGAKPVGHDTLETLRIEAGIPRHGRDMDETNVVTETNLDDAVSFTKGCYIGQEIIVRIKHRGHVAKKLSGIMFDGADVVRAGTAIKTADDKEIGRVTSVATSPRLSRNVALGYLRYEFLKPGTKVEVPSEKGEVTGTVQPLPFVRGSWYAE